jgi:hypothetical protein
MTGMQGPGFDIFGFLDEPGRPASVATVTASGQPALAMMWYSFEDDHLWFHSPEAGPAPFLRAAAENREVPVGDVAAARHGGGLSRPGRQPGVQVVRAGRAARPPGLSRRGVRAA